MAFVPNKSVEEAGKGRPEEAYAIPSRPCLFPRALRTVSVRWLAWWGRRGGSGAPTALSSTFKASARTENLECLCAGSKLPTCQLATAVIERELRG
jgi:hypothetical protein